MALKKGKTPEAQNGEMQDMKAQMAAMQGTMEAVLQLLQAKGPAVVKASDKDWNDMTKTEHIVTGGDALQAETEASKLKDDLLDLINSSKSQKTLTGVIIGVKSANADNETATQLAEVKYGNDTCTVLIPSYELWNYDEEKFRVKGYETGIKKNMVDMIGAEINFIVVRVDKGSRTAIASRLRALEKEVNLNYIRITRRGKPRVTAGSLAEAKILAIKAHSIVVNVLGIDTAIPAMSIDNRLAWEYVVDCPSWCAENGLTKNKIIQVRVQQIELQKVKKLNHQYVLGAAKVSYKDTCPNPLEAYWDSIHEGEIGMATVTAVTEVGVFCTYKHRGVPILCKMPDLGTPPAPGERRTVEVTLKEDRPENGKRIFGIFKGIARA